jgi:hypothetical protein
MDAELLRLLNESYKEENANKIREAREEARENKAYLELISYVNKKLQS